MIKNFETEFLFLELLTHKDREFIFELVNTAGWLKFIGDRNVRNLEYASAYIERILTNPHATYWTVKLKSTLQPIGVITLIKRDYLQYPDLGFAFLPQHAKKGYAFEALNEAIKQISNFSNHSVFMAVTVQENFSSIKLLEKSGFIFEKIIPVDGEDLSLYRYEVPLK